MDSKILTKEEIAKIAGEVGAKIAIDTYEKEKKNALKERRDRRLRNTKLLLRNYQMLKAHSESAVYDAAKLKAQDVDIVDLMECVFVDDELFVESIKRSAERTWIIMSHVNEMLRLYEIYCFTSDKPEDRRRYRVLHSMYIDEPVLKTQEIADKEGIDTRTVYKDINAATQKLSALLFGIDGLNITK